MNEAGQIEMFPTELRLLRVDAEQIARRFFLLTVQPDLFGGAASVLEGGQVGLPGQIERVRFPDEGQAIDALKTVTERKVVRGYLLLQPS